MTYINHFKCVCKFRQKKKISLQILGQKLCVWQINVAFGPLLIHHWGFTGRTLGVNISLIRFSWQARLVYSTIYHIHLQHNIMRHNKQGEPSFDYFHLVEKYIFEGSKKCPVQGPRGENRVSVQCPGLAQKEIRLNECEIKSTVSRSQTCLGEVSSIFFPQMV